LTVPAVLEVAGSGVAGASPSSRPTSPPLPGPVLFARYAYPPNRLGLCGPDDAPALRDGATAGALRELRELARGFEGAYPYLKLLATENGLQDPLDRRVVEAYWLGNDLAANVGPRALHRSVEERFRKRMSPGDWRWLELAVGGGSHPVHAFHVLEIFPRIGLMRGGDDPGPVIETMDACRIRWGRVISVHGDRLVVEAARLELVHGSLRLGRPRVEAVSAWSDVRGPLGGAHVGDVVSLHWGWACERLAGAQLGRVAAWTHAALDLANRSI
jgi:Family of unknown function (DUF6390)